MCQGHNTSRERKSNLYEKLTLFRKKCRSLTALKQRGLTTIKLLHHFSHRFCYFFWRKARIAECEKFCDFAQGNDGFAYVWNERDKNVIKFHNITCYLSDMAEYREFTIFCENEDPLTAMKLFFQPFCAGAVTVFLTILSAWIKIRLFLASTVIFLHQYSPPSPLHNMYKKGVKARLDNHMERDNPFHL